MRYQAVLGLFSTCFCVAVEIKRFPVCVILFASVFVVCQHIRCPYLQPLLCTYYDYDRVFSISTTFRASSLGFPRLFAQAHWCRRALALPILCWVSGMWRRASLRRVWALNARFSRQWRVLAVIAGLRQWWWCHFCITQMSCEVLRCTQKCHFWCFVEAVFSLQRPYCEYVCGASCVCITDSVGGLRHMGASLAPNLPLKLSAWGGQLRALQMLELQNNQLVSLPESFGQLSALRILDLQYNQLVA